MNTKLDQIENKLREIFEQHLLNIFPGVGQPSSLINDLIQVMENNLQESPSGLPLAPDCFKIALHPEDLSVWETHQDLLDEIAITLNEVASQQHLTFVSVPKIELEIDPTLSSGDTRVTAYFTPPKPSLPDTAAMEQTHDYHPENHLPKNAFLIVGGKESITLDQPVINIGRHSKSDLVLDDLHISRRHAQLRAINGRFIIFDLGSTGGTFLNGKRITQATLQPGDVIRLGTINLIYIQDSTADHVTTSFSSETDINQNTEDST